MPMKPVGKVAVTVGKTVVGRQMPDVVRHREHVRNLGCR